ncbi:hypothetical protein FQA39_LY10000 [Lamprigera yunnana]|nr:hypothetical protein FQA39_LY10000 [Lamprigera yunnana]
MLSKIILTLTFLVACGTCNEIPQRVSKWDEFTAPVVEKCMKESNTALSLVEEISKIRKVPNDANFGCFLKCVYEYLKLFNANNEFDKQTLMDTFFYIDENIADTCIKEASSGTDLCRKSYLMGDCVVRAAFN